MLCSSDSVRSAARLCLLLVLALMLVACGPRAVRQVAEGSELPPPDTTNAQGVYKGSSEYRLGPQDLIEISVFGVDRLSQAVRVNSNGQISLPLVGSITAGGMTIPDLETELAARYADGYLQSPQVSVFVKEFASQRLTFEGAVNAPGIYPLTGRTTLLQGIAIAKGLDQLADPRGVVLFRTINGQKMAAVYDIRELRNGKIEDPVLYGDDVVVVEQSGSKTALRRFIETMPALAWFRFF